MVNKDVYIYNTNTELNGNDKANSTYKLQSPHSTHPSRY